MTGERETILIVGFLKVYIAVKRPLERDLGIVIGEIQFQKLLRLHDAFEYQFEPFVHLAAILGEYVLVLFNPWLSEPLKIEAVGAFVRLRRRRPAPDSILELLCVFAHLKQCVVGLNRIAGVALVNTRLLAAAVVLGLAAAEIYFVGMERPSDAVVAVLINKLAGLHSAGNSDRAALLKILGYELSSRAENGNVEKVGRAIAFLVTVSTVYSNRKVTYGSTCVGGLEFRVAGQAANNYNLVQIYISFLVVLLHCLDGGGNFGAECNGRDFGRRIVAVVLLSNQRVNLSAVNALLNGCLRSGHDLLTSVG